MKKAYEYEEVQNQVIDLSGIDNPHQWLYEQTNGIYYPTTLKLDFVYGDHLPITMDHKGITHQLVYPLKPLADEALELIKAGHSVFILELTGNSEGLKQWLYKSLPADHPARTGVRKMNDIIRALQAFKTAANALQVAWTNYDEEGGTLLKDYPFGGEFSDLCHDINKWVDTSIKSI